MNDQIDGAAILQRRREEAAAYALTAQQNPLAGQTGLKAGAGTVREFLPTAEIYARRAMGRMA